MGRELPPGLSEARKTALSEFYAGHITAGELSQRMSGDASGNGTAQQQPAAVSDPDAQGDAAAGALVGSSLPPATAEQPAVRASRGRRSRLAWLIPLLAAAAAGGAVGVAMGSSSLAPAAHRSGAGLGSRHAKHVAKLAGKHHSVDLQGAVLTNRPANGGSRRGKRPGQAKKTSAKTKTSTTPTTTTSSATSSHTTSRPTSTSTTTSSTPTTTTTSGSTPTTTTGTSTGSTTTTTSTSTTSTGGGSSTSTGTSTTPGTSTDGAGTGTHSADSS